MLRVCKDCGEQKELNKFVNQNGKYRFKCKECKNKARRTGRPNEGKFKPGHDKGVRFQKGHTPWYKVKGVPPPAKGNVDRDNFNRFSSHRYKVWREAVFEKHGKNCKLCQNDKRVGIHHLKSWKEDEGLRFDPENGIPLCCSCHGSLEALIRKNKKEKDLIERQSKVN